MKLHHHAADVPVGTPLSVCGSTGERKRKEEGPTFLSRGAGNKKERKTRRGKRGRVSMLQLFLFSKTIVLDVIISIISIIYYFDN